MALVLAGPLASMKAKLSQKTKYLPTAAIAKILPAGSSTLDSVPTLAQFGGGRAGDDSRLALDG